MKNHYTVGTKNWKLVELLKNRCWHHVRELAKAGGFRFGARLKELREDGHTILPKRDKKDPSVFHYRMTA
jgi:hypothetical protein